MKIFESFIFEFKTKIQIKNAPEKFAELSIHSTDRGALVKVFENLIVNDKSGVIRQEIKKVLLKAEAEHNKN